MKIAKHFFGFLIFILGSFLILNSCKKDSYKDNEQSSPITKSTYIEEEAYRLVDINKLEKPLVSDGIKEEFKIDKPEKEKEGTPCSFKSKLEDPSKNTKSGTDKEKDMKGIPNLGSFIKIAGFTQEQLASLDKFMITYCDCISGPFDKVNEVDQKIIEKYNLQREELFKLFNEGKISKEDFNLKLKALEMSLKEEISKDSVKIDKVLLMKECQDDLFESIGSILTEKQKPIWKEWLVKQ